MIDKDILKELLREAFQDFDLLDYTYSINIKLGLLETNRSGTFTKCTKRWCVNHIKVDGRENLYLYNNPMDLYKSGYALAYNKTYKDYFLIHFSFKAKGVVNKKKFDEFFLDGRLKLNHFLKKYDIELPVDKKTIIEFIGKEKELIVDFSYRLKV